MIRRLFFASIIIQISACTVGPDYIHPEMKIPEQWHESKANLKPGVPDDWWHTFNDNELDRLIKEAISANIDYKIALERIKDARAQRTIAFAAGLPSLSVRSTGSRRFNNTSGATQSGGSTAGGGFGIGNQIINIFQLGFDAQWELDLFGGIRREVEAADAAIDSEVENSRDILVTLLGDVARNYIELRANQLLLNISHKNYLAQRETQSLTENLQKAGLSSSLEVAQAQAQADTTEAQIPKYETLVQQSIHALSVLLEREPGALALRFKSLAAIPVNSNQVIPDLPSELLKRRPDIRRAERQMAVANASIGVATAELYPKINLAAFIGLQNSSIKDFTPLGKSWSAASTLTMPIFNWGKLNANIRSKKSQFEQAFLNYRSIVLAAFKEVEDALIAYNKERERNKVLGQAAIANQLAVQLAQERYQKGLTGFIDVLQSQQELYQAESNLAESTATISSNLVALYKTLGGGWQSESWLSDKGQTTE